MHEESIIKLLANYDIRNKVAEKGYVFCRNKLGIDRMIDETITIYEEALKY